MKPHPPLLVLVDPWKQCESIWKQAMRLHNNWAKISEDQNKVNMTWLIPKLLRFAADTALLLHRLPSCQKWNPEYHVGTEIIMFTSLLLVSNTQIHNYRHNCHRFQGYVHQILAYLPNINPVQRCSAQTSVLFHHQLANQRKVTGFLCYKS